LRKDNADKRKYTSRRTERLWWTERPKAGRAAGGGQSPVGGAFLGVTEGIILAYTNALSAYRETRIKTASQGQLIIMLYDEAIKHLDRGLDLLGMNTTGKKDPGKIEQISKSILKTQEIITELMVSLDFEQGGDIAKNLFSLYTWFNQELLEANVKQDIRRVTIIRNMVNELRGAWNEIAAKTPTENRTGSAGVNIAG
jgi:flagellar protein FliS